MECPRCTSEMNRGRCPQCGYTVPSQRDSDTDDKMSKLKGLATLLTVILFLGYLIFNTSLMLLSAQLILPETLVNENVILVVIGGLPVGLTYISGYTFAIYFLFILGAILLSYAFIFYTGWEALVSYMKNVVRGKFRKLDKDSRATSSPIMRLVTVFTAIIFIGTVYLLMLELVGRGIERPDEDMHAWMRIFGPTQAAVWEEIVVRIAYIGLPMVIYALAKGKKNFTKYLLGGFGFKESFSVTLVIISSIVFALAHLPAWGWDPLQILWVIPVGIFFGYLFVKDGIHSAILLHFVWNYFSVPGILFDAPDINLILFFMRLFWMAVGLYYTYEYITKFLHWLPEEREKEKVRQKEKFEEERKVKDHTAGVTIGYVCQSCGYNKAEYTDEGKLRCTRCGTKTDPKSPQVQQQKKLLQTDKWPPS